jgi:hypothetical protein
MFYIIQKVNIYSSSAVNGKQLRKKKSEKKKENE